MSRVHVFVISWRGQHEQAAIIAEALSGKADYVSIVYSEQGSQPACFNGYHLIRRDDQLFWADKFQACLEHCAADEVMLVIHADCRCDDWAKLVARCKAAFTRFGDLGIWAPRLTGTPWHLQRTRLHRMAGSDLSIVAHTDGIIFALNPKLYPRMRAADYSNNLFGHGIDWLFLCAAYARGMKAITDEGIIVHHPITRGYSTKEARAQKRAFLKQLSEEELVVYMRLRAHVRKRRIYHKLHWLVEQHWLRGKTALRPLPR